MNAEMETNDADTKKQEERRTDMDQVKETPVVTEDEQKELPDSELDQASGGMSMAR